MIDVFVAPPNCQYIHHLDLDKQNICVNIFVRVYKHKTVKLLIIVLVHIKILR